MSVKDESKDGAPLSELFEMLSHECRRRILVAVARKNPQDEDEITSKSVAHEHSDDGDAAGRLKQQLYHIHLPKLDEARFIDWDRASGRITRGPRFAEIEPLLTLLSDRRDELPYDWL